MHPSIRDLIQHGIKQTWISYEEINTSLPDEMVRPDKIDVLLQILDDLGIERINYEDPRLRRGLPFYAPLQTNLKFKLQEPFVLLSVVIEDRVNSVSPALQFAHVGTNTRLWVVD